MGKPQKTTIKTWLDEWATLQERKTSLELERDKKLNKHIEAFESVCAPIKDKYEPQITELTNQSIELEKKIATELKKGIGDDGTASLPLVVSDKAKAEVNSRQVRQINVEDWLNAVPKSEWGVGFFGTLDVLIQKADKFRSDLVAKLAKSKRTHSVSVTLKSEGR